MLRKSAVLLLLLAGAVATGLPTAAARNFSTQIIRYVPSQVATTTIEGRCWTNSIAAARPDAWRCMAGNEIFDPCFEAADGRSVVCNPNPAKGFGGFGLRLKEPLPKPDLPATAVVGGGVWLVELADGTLCSPATGARGVVDGKMITHYCESPADGADTVLLDDLTTAGPQWVAEKATLVHGSSGPKQLKSEIVNVKTAWQ